MDYNQAFEKLKAIKQEHILAFFDSLSKIKKEMLLNQIDKLDAALFKKQQALVFQKEEKKPEIAPCDSAVQSEFILPDEEARKMLEEGKIGCLLVAGGQGTRLEFEGPKGLYLVSPVKKKSLFQIFAEKTIAAGKLAKRLLPLAIMTSEENRKETEEFFKENDYFGLFKNQIYFFTQKSLPMLTEEGNLFLTNPFSIAKGADGNGSSLKQFFDSGIFEKWLKNGVQFVNYVLIDNPLADPFDEKLLFFQSSQKQDVLIKCIKREDPKENVGVLGKKDGHISVIEYSEISENERFTKNNQGELLYPFANISLFSFSMDFIRKAAAHEKEMPLHKAFKQVSKTHLKGWKFERFIFDVLSFAKNILLIEYPRQECFSPLKNKAGRDSLKTVQHDMETKDIKIMRKITTSDAAVLTPFEIAQDFYYPTKELIEKWKKKTIPQKHYIEP
ncbi:MAG TPA: UTP--glucose-1-phosphate uridylyltransferase [Parachlamydiaceae bacterium]|nr:UTP--glucose-1-phosphate uridylyltransferase [Parachlamydiaceae bacterium]